MVSICHERRLAGHVFAYDLEHEKSGAGVLLLEDLIRHCCDEGITTLDLMAPADAYKLDWADGSVITQDWAVSHTLAGRLYRTLYLELLQEPLKRMAEGLPAPIRHRILAGLKAVRGRRGTAQPRPSE